MITVIGSRPLPYKNSEQRILPRLKLGTQAPNFDLTKLRQQLIDDTSDAGRVRLLKGLHEKLWHELKDGMERFLRRLGVPDRCYELIDTVIKTCEQCNAFKHCLQRHVQCGACADLLLSLVSVAQCIRAQCKAFGIACRGMHSEVHARRYSSWREQCGIFQALLSKARAARCTHSAFALSVSSAERLLAQRSQFCS